MTKLPLRIGTRGSPLALAQAHQVQALLAAAHSAPAEMFEIVVIRTSGDAIQDRPLSEAGGKGLFTKEIDAAMLRGEIDIAVHSSKDLPTLLPDGIFIAGYLEREDPRDALISPRAARIGDLPQGAKFGTASLRRQALAKRLRPDLNVSLLRGNVETRLKRAESGDIDATVLAYAGLKRLGLAHRATAVLDVNDFPPAIGQGAIGLTAREGDAPTLATLAPIQHADTGVALAAERAFLAVLDGSCRTPIAGHARLVDGYLKFHGMVLLPEGTKMWEVRGVGPPDRAESLGKGAGEDLKARLPAGALPTLT